MEMNRNHSEVSEQQEMKGVSFVEAERNPEKEEQRGKALGAQQDMKKPGEQEEKTEKKEIDTKETKEEKREKNIDSSQELYAESSKGEGQKTSDTTETTPKKTRLEDLSWQDIHQMQKEDPEKLQAMNKDYQERFSAEALGMNVEEYRAHMDRIAKANESDETQENTLTEDWHSQMGADLFQNQNLNFEEEQVDEKKDSVQEKSEKPENAFENPQENLEDKGTQESTFTIENGKIEPETQTPIESESHSEKEVMTAQETRDEQRYANLNETQDLFKKESSVDEHSKMEEGTSENKELGSKEEQLDQNDKPSQEQREKSEDSQKDVKDEEVESSFSNVEDKKIEQEAQTSIESEEQVDDRLNSEQEESAGKSDLSESSIVSETQQIPKENIEHSESDYESFESQEVDGGEINQVSSVELSEEKKEQEVLPYSSEIQEKIERYSSKSFTKENSFDATVDNKDKICENNHILSEEDGEKMLSKEQMQEIKDLRESVPPPTEDTVMQKVIPEEQIKRYIAPDSDKINDYGGLFGGCISKAEDAAPFTRTPKEAFENLRLDFQKNPYQKGEVPIYVVRFNIAKDELDKLSIPYGNEFAENGEEHPLDKPMTGSGFTGSKDVLIPEYMTTSLEDDKSKSNITPTDGMIFKVYEDENGNPVEEPYAIWDDENDKFVLLNKVGEQYDR